MPRGANRPLHSGNWGGVAPNENLEVERFFAGIKTAASVLTHLGARSGSAR